MQSDPKIEKTKKVILYVLAIPALAITSGVIYLALKAALGLLALGVTAGVGVVMIRLAPWASEKLANLVMKLRVKEAAENPIETMRSIQIEKSEELRAADVAIVEFETEVRNYEDEARTFAQQYPEEADAFNEIGQKMREGLAQQKEEQANARAQLADLEVRIAKGEAIYKMALAAQRVTAFSKSAEAKVFQQIREKVAFDAVRSSLNQSFASLNMALAQRKNIAALPAAQARAAVLPLKSKVEVIK